RRALLRSSDCRRRCRNIWRTGSNRPSRVRGRVAGAAPTRDRRAWQSGRCPAGLDFLHSPAPLRSRWWFERQTKPRRALPLISACLASPALAQIFQTHEESPFHGVKHNTRKTYTDSLKVILSTVAARLVRNVRTDRQNGCQNVFSKHEGYQHD